MCTAKRASSEKCNGSKALTTSVVLFRLFHTSKVDKHDRSIDITVLAVSNCVEHDSTSYAVLKGVEVEF